MPSFTLIEEFSGLSGRQWLFFALLLAVVVVAILLISRFQRKDQKKGQKNYTRMLVYAALCIALSFVLSYVRLFKMPQGGSITLASMLPVILYAYWFGAGPGFAAALVYGVLQFFQDPYFFSLAQFLLDYIIGFGALGLAALFKNLPLGTLVAGAGRFLCSFISGIVFFGDYAPEGVPVALYSFVYQFSSIGWDTIICVVLAVILVRTGTIERLRPQGARQIHSKTQNLHKSQAA